MRIGDIVFFTIIATLMLYCFLMIFGVFAYRYFSTLLFFLPLIIIAITETYFPESKISKLMNKKIKKCI